jgi:hypothetical protein
MAEQEDILDADLIRRFVEGDQVAFGTLYWRCDADIMRVLRKQLHSVTDHEHRAREIADMLWVQLYAHPNYLSGHDPSRRPVRSYLELLARRAAQRFLLKLPEREELLGDEDENIADLFDEFERQADQYGEIAQSLSAKTLARALKIVHREQPTTTEQHWLRWLVRRLRKKLNLS